MKRIIPILILFSILFSACGSSQVVPSTIKPSSTNTSVPTLSEPTPTLTLVDSAENWETIKPLETDLPNDVTIYNGRTIGQWYDGRTISPDGQWIVTNYDSIPPTNSNKIISISNPEKAIDFTYSIPSPTPQAYTFDSWSPDSTGFVGIYYGPTTSGLDYCCGQAIEISNFSNGKSQSYIYTWGWYEKPDIYWSWDSSKIGLAFRDKGFWILDRQANLIKRIPLNDISSLIWSKNSIYATTYTQTAQHHYKYILYKVNFDNNSAEQLYGFDGNVDLIGYDENLDQLLILITVSYPLKKLLLFDLIKNETVKEIDLLSEIYNLITSSSLQHIAISTMDGSLWIFDFTKQSLKYYGKIANLLGWFSNINGFLVTTKNGDFKIIKP